MNRISVLFCLGSCLFLFSCTEDDPGNYPSPRISFISTDGYTSADTTLKINESVLIGIESRSMSNSSLTLFHTAIEYNGEITRIDSGLNSATLSVRKTLTKGPAEMEKWSFYTRDRDGRQSDTISLTLILSDESEYGPILRFDTLIMAAQDNPLPSQMLALPSGKLYSTGDATANQENIWLLYYYDNMNTDKNTIASPGANIDAGIYDLSGWTVNNTSRFVPLDDIPEDNAFLSAENDSLILSHTFEYSSGKRKAKKLAGGDYISFVTESNKRGIIRVLEVLGQETGHTKIQLIIQK